MSIRTLALLFVAVVTVSTSGQQGNPLAYLDSPLDPYHVHRDFPRLTTPQWVGEPDVDAVVVLAIDDMRDTAKYEQYLRPILDRLKQIDGRAPVSIMTNTVDPQDPQLKRWLQEGLSIDVHTIDHPCPCLADGDFDKAKATYDRCVDLLNTIDGNSPVAFRMPCCDSQNTPSPRFWSEIFNRRTPQGNFLAIDSSVFNITTSKDSELPKSITLESDGKERFRKYLPFPSFVNTIEDYPYPYVIGNLCWEFPCVVPSDWEAQNLHQPNNPKTVEDLKLALDAVVLKQGTFNLVFHPHGWIRAEQVIELIDHAVGQYGSRVKFLSFREALDRINQHLLAGHPLRNETGQDNRVRLLDVNEDSHMDVVIHGDHQAGEPVEVTTRVWSNSSRKWKQHRQELDAPLSHFKGDRGDESIKAMGISRDEGFVTHGIWDGKWVSLLTIFQFAGMDRTWINLIQRPSDLDAVRFRDLDNNGNSELILVKGERSLILATKPGDATYVPTGFTLPKGVRLVRDNGGDAGLRLIDVDRDGDMDCLFSDGERYSLHLFESMEKGWSQEIIQGERGKAPGKGPVVPVIVRSDGANNGAWFHSNHLWIQNEHTDRLPDSVDRLSFDDMLQASERQGALWPPARSPKEALTSMKTLDGLKVELVASEPLIVDPVAFDWGPDGRLWVVEMRDYPNGIDGQGQPGGRVKVLFDDDKDGYFDRANVFLDDLPFPSGVKVWRKGVLVSAAPEIFYAEDTDGDDVADQRETLFRGFGEGNQQHRVNGMRWGIDNWLYVANGDSGGEIESLKTGQRVNVRGRDLRIRPDTGEIEALAGQTQFGRCQDDYGNWFGGNNSNPIWHYVLEDRYTRRNPHVASPSAKHAISVRPGPAPVFPISKTLERFNDFDRADRFTSACSPMIYRDRRIDERSFSYVCEPVHNLVQREFLEPQGVTFTSRRAEGEEQTEFLASDDNWFRPVMVRTAPDGSIWVADMYRLVIEHPEWIPQSWQQKVDVRAGDHLGRIYRIRASNKLHRDVPNLCRLSGHELVRQLDSSNGTWRDLVQQLLIWRDDKSIASGLRKLLQESNNGPTPIHALYILDALDALDKSALAHALGHASAQVRRHAVRLAEKQYRDTPELDDLLFELAESRNGDLALEMQLAYSLGHCTSARCAEALGTIALRHADNRYLLAAVMSSLNNRNIGTVLNHVVDHMKHPYPSKLLHSLMVSAVSLGDDSTLRTAIGAVTASDSGVYATWQWDAMPGLMSALSRGNRAEALSKPQQRQMAAFFSAAREMVDNQKVDQARRLAAVRLLRFKHFGVPGDIDLLSSLLSPKTPSDLQSVALESLVARAPELWAERILLGWRAHSPRLRNQALDLLMRREKDVRRLMMAVQAGTIRESELSTWRRQQLQNHSRKSIRDLAEAVFATQRNSRAEVLQQFKASSTLEGDEARGREVFKKSCSNCHLFDGFGHSVGPDLAALTNKSSEAIQIAVLDPNRAVEDQYREYLAITEDGRQIAGILSAETSNSITLSSPEGRHETISRHDIEELASTGRSLMPEGLEKELTPQSLADVIAYVRTQSPPSKSFPGHHPRLAPVRDDGSIRLLGMHARIYGPTLIFEPQYRNLGFWQSVEDHAVWDVEIPKSGSYRVMLIYACPEESAGNELLLEAAGQTLRKRIESSGDWDSYRSVGLGTLDLRKGKTEIVARSAGPIQSFLMDLQSIQLHPVD